MQQAPNPKKMAPLEGLEPPHVAPEATALSSELQGHAGEGIYDFKTILSTALAIFNGRAPFK